MNVVVTLEHRFQRTPDGAVWSQAQYLYSFWAPYLSVFDQVRAVARVLDVQAVPADWKRADGPRVSFVAIPYYIGPWRYLLRSRQVRRSALAALEPDDAVIIRGGSPIADTIEGVLRPLGRPFGLEVLGDPYEALAPGAVRHPLRPFFRWWFTRELRRHCRHASAVAYVTRNALQDRYPCPGYSAQCSDVQLPESAFVDTPRSPARTAGPWTLVSVGSLEQLYKGSHVLIDAVADCIREGLDLRLVLVGDGKHRPELEAQAIALGLNGRVVFRGQLTAGQSVRAELDQADLYVMPSFTEGLPRAMVEAMARALPCVGSNVGGIPELLPAEDLVAPGDRNALAAKLREVVADANRLQRMSVRNLETSRGYREEILSGQRIAFYQNLREQTEEWLRRNNGKAGSHHHRA